MDTAPSPESCCAQHPTQHAAEHGMPNVTASAALAGDLVPFAQASSASGMGTPIDLPKSLHVEFQDVFHAGSHAELDDEAIQRTISLLNARANRARRDAPAVARVIRRFTPREAASG